MSASEPLRVVGSDGIQRPTDTASLFRRIDNVDERTTDWLLPGRIIRGSVCLLEGDPSVGKSTLLSELAAVITTGRPWLGRPESEPQGVLWLTADEDAGSMIRPRLTKANADTSRVHVIATDPDGHQPRITIPGSIRTLRNAIAELNLALIIFDPLISFTGSDCDLNNEGHARAALDPCVLMCADTRCCLLAVRQLKKDRTGPRITHGLGSMAVGAVARTILQLDRPEATLPRRILRTVKCSGGPAAKPLAYSLHTVDGPPVMIGVRELGEAEDDAAGDLVDAGERHVRQDARELLQTLLKDTWVKASTVISLASSSGIGERTLWKVKAELRCASRRTGGGEESYSEWGPPGSADPPPPPPVQSTPVQGKKAKTPRKSRKKE